MKLKPQSDKNRIRDRIISEIEKLDPKLDKNTETFKVATILLAGIQVGANAENIAKLLNLKIEEVTKYEEKLRVNEIWIGDKTVCDWFDEESGGIAFWMDVSVALGDLERNATKN